MGFWTLVKEKVVGFFRKFCRSSKDSGVCGWVGDQDRLSRLRSVRIFLLISFLISLQVLLISLKSFVFLFPFVAVVTLFLFFSWMTLKFYDLLKTGRIRTLWLYIIIFLVTILLVTVAYLSG